MPDPEQDKVNEALAGAGQAPELNELTKAQAPSTFLTAMPGAPEAGAANANLTTVFASIGAKKAPDGNYYVNDPRRPGKYLKVINAR
jgi:hypothetical protein